MTPAPLVSICIITYNHGPYIQDCLMSALSQHVQGDVEILLGDDASTDDTEGKVRDILAAHPGRITYLRRDTNLGGCANLQDLVRRARGRFIAQLDGDDLWLPGKLAAQLEFLHQRPECIACYTNAVAVNDAGEQLGAFSSAVPACFDLPFLLRRGNFLNHSSMVYRSEFRPLVLGFSGDFIDYQVHLRFAGAGALGFLNTARVVYRMGSSQSAVRSTPDLVLDLYLRGVAEALDHPQVDTATRLHALRHFWTMIAVDGLLKRQPGRAAAWARRLRPLARGAYPWLLVSGMALAVQTICKLVLRRLLIAAFGMTKLRVMHER